MPRPDNSEISRLACLLLIRKRFWTICRVSPSDKSQAERMRREAEAQLKLLTDASNLAQSDFYSYRYFASEGFLPGYNFPRLPLSAYILSLAGRSYIHPSRLTKQWILESV